MKIKSDVDLRGLQPQMAIAAIVAASVYAANGAELMITSGTEGTHMKGSLHYKGLALDLRLPGFSGEAATNLLVSNLRANLGPQFDVVLEGTHVHIEWDPKTPAVPHS